MNIFSMPFYALRVLLLASLTILGVSACGGGGGGGDTPSATLQSIEISPLNATLPAGTAQQFAAMAIFSNNTKTDVTSATTWTSSDASTVSISSAGLATAVKVGNVTITGSFQGRSASTGLTVSAALVRSIAVTPTNASLAKGSSGQATATATFSDNSTLDVTMMAAWVSSSTAVATVSNADGSRGLVTAVSQGKTDISASFQGVRGTGILTVTAAALSSIQVTPVSRSIAKGTTQQFAATGVYTDNSTQNLTTAVTWASSSTAVASISNASNDKGLASGVAMGTTTISATSGNIVGSTTLAVSAATLTALQVTPATASRPKGSVQQFTATGTFTDQSTQDLTTMVVWSSSATAIATISNATGSNGQATGMSEGTATITAASGSVSSTAAFTVTAATLSRIDITPSQPSIPVGTTQQFIATGVYTDNTTQDLTSLSSWSSSDTSVLEISNSDGQRGFAVANKQGAATVSAISMGLTGTTLATVSTATLTSIQVTPANGRVAKGFSLQYKATGTFSDNTTRDITTQVSWAVTNPSFASISNANGSRGLATATSMPGSTNINATSGSLTGATSLTVTDATLTAVAVTPTNPSFAKGVSGQLTATGTFSDNSTQNLTEQASWSSFDTDKVTVSNSTGSKGLAMAVNMGSSTVTASVQNAVATTAVNGSTMVTVTDATLTSIAVTPGSVSLADGTTQQFNAQGTYSDNSTADITTTVTWSSSNTGVVTISNANGSQGLATAAGPGSATITATSGSVSSTAAVMVTNATLVSIDVMPKTPSVAAGRSQQFSAVGTYTDGSMQTLTSTVAWSSDTTAVATISNTSESAGLASSTAKGTTKINAASAGVSSADVTLTVTDAVPVSLLVTPANRTIGNNTSLQFTATETFSDGSSSDQTTAVVWSSNNLSVVDISNAADSKGLATAKMQGTVTITATDASVTPNITANTGLTVGTASLQGITVSGTPSTLPAGGYTVQYRATGTYADGSTQDITDSASWSTLTPAVATVSNAAGSKGVVTSATTGTTAVVATVDSVNGNRNITVTNATLSAISVTPANASIDGGDTLQYTAIGNFSDSSTLDITRQVTWASSSTTAATIDQNGLATGATGAASILGGNTTITARRGMPVVTGQTMLTRNPGP